MNLKLPRRLSALCYSLNEGVNFSVYHNNCKFLLFTLCDRLHFCYFMFFFFFGIRTNREIMSTTQMCSFFLFYLNVKPTTMPTQESYVLICAYIYIFEIQKRSARYNGPYSLFLGMRMLRIINIVREGQSYGYSIRPITAWNNPLVWDKHFFR